MARRPDKFVSGISMGLGLHVRSILVIRGLDPRMTQSSQQAFFGRVKNSVARMERSAIRDESTRLRDEPPGLRCAPSTDSSRREPRQKIGAGNAGAVYRLSLSGWADSLLSFALAAAANRRTKMPCRAAPRFRRRARNRWPSASARLRPVR